MIEFINRVTGTKMWVAENRVEEYKAAGHVPAAVPAMGKPAEEKPKKARKATKK